MGQATVEITVSRPGMPTHELLTPPGTPHPLLAAAKVVEAIREVRGALAGDGAPWVGAETYFVGELHGGDFYNRFPSACRIVGTRRWAPGNTLAAVEAEYRELLARVAEETGCDDRARPAARPRPVRDRPSTRCAGAPGGARAR